MPSSLLVSLVLFCAESFAQAPTAITSNPTATILSQTYVLPMSDPSPGLREEQVSQHRQGYLYGPPLLGNLSFFPTGQLGDALVAAELALFDPESEISGSIISLESQEVVAAVTPAANTIQAIGNDDVSAYLALYYDQWKASNPDGLDPGAYTNYSQDLYFSMERLSVNPFSLSRLHPNQSLPFEVADNITEKLSGTTLANLHQSGRLFVVDYTSFINMPRQPGRFAASCQAYFYLHPRSVKFLPLAIKTNEGADLTYTPLDHANDWFLAKTLFEANDAAFADLFHLSAAHAPANIVYEAALRTLADQHPIRGYLDQIMYRAFAVMVAGNLTLFNPGGPVDQNFPFTAATVLEWNSELYHKSSGHFQANYFERSFRDRGLVNCSYGPALPHFPFYEDAAMLVESFRFFAEAYVEAYYINDSLVAGDTELQSWITEANGPAQVLDFPSAPLTSRTTLVDILTQMSYLTGVLHHALNSGAYAASWWLPLHPVAHYKPLPTEKGIDSVLPFMPNISKSISEISLFLAFNRPSYKYQGLNLLAVFSSLDFLNRTNGDVQAAATELQMSLGNQSEANQAKDFDENGLSQGMPFIWRTLDPIRLPYFLDI